MAVIALAEKRLPVAPLTRAHELMCALCICSVVGQCAGALCVVCTVTVIAATMKHLPVAPLAHAHELMCALYVCSVAGQPAGFLVGVRTMTIIVSATRLFSLL